MIKMRIRYSKEEEACLLSHHEVQAALVRWLRRSGLSLVYSEGFNERVRIETGIPTAVGMVSLQEHVDVLLNNYSRLADRCAALERTAPPGLRFLAAVDIPLEAPSLMAQPLILGYEFAWQSRDGVDADYVKAGIVSFMALSSLSVTREGGKTHAPKDIRKYVLTAQIMTRTPLRVHVGVFFDQSGTIRMDEITRHVMGLDPEETPLPVITRESVLIKTGEAFVDPMAVALQLAHPRRQGNGHRS